jgi:hypothetical protein
VLHGNLEEIVTSISNEKGRRKPKLVALGVLAAVLALSSASIASATVRDNNTGSQQLPTKASVSGTGTAGTIECSWALPDLNPAGGREQNNTGTPNPTPPTTFWYGLDDDPLTSPGPATPCDLGPHGAKPTLGDARHHFIQVLPNSADSPAERRIELWAAADHPAGIGAISDVYWKVFHGDGVLKVQLHGVRIDASSSRPDCNGPNSVQPGSTESMFQAAIDNGELTSASVHDPTNGMVALCQEGVKALFHNTFTVSKDQPNGEYKVETHEVSAGGLESVQTFYIDIVPFYDMNLDFNGVDYAQIIPGITKTISGDTLFGTPAPTVLNTGNSAMGLGLAFTDLVQVTNQTGDPVQGGKHITDFDGSFGISANTIQHIPLIKGGAPVTTFDDGQFRQLCSDDDGKLDLSVEPPSTLPAGSYQGVLTIVAHSPTTSFCPTDHGHLYVPNSGVRGTS